jgi:hypothetical protein
MDDKQGSNDGAGTAPAAKKPFDPPRLRVYGDIASLTRTVGRTGLSDGGHGNTVKTRP